MTVEVSVGREVQADFRALPTQALQREALEYLVRLKSAPRLGLQLSSLADTGDLGDCRKIYFGGARFRIVYRLEPSDEAPRRAYIIAIGKRVGLEVYRVAVVRLGRAP